MSILPNLPTQKIGEVNGSMIPKTFRPEKEPKPKKKKPENNDGIPAKLRKQVMHESNYTCADCGATRGEGAKLHVDHIIPKADHGPTIRANLQCLCRDCNLGKKRSLKTRAKPDWSTLVGNQAKPRRRKPNPESIVSNDRLIDQLKKIVNPNLVIEKKGL